MLPSLFLSITATECPSNVTSSAPVFCTFNGSITPEITLFTPNANSFTVVYSVSGAGIVRFYRQKLVGKPLNVEWTVPLQSIPFAYRAVAGDSLATISLLSPTVYEFAFANGSLCYDGVLFADTSPGLSTFQLNTSEATESQYQLLSGNSKCLFLMNPKETEVNISGALLSGDSIWINDTYGITGNESLSIERQPGGPPLLLRFVIGRGRGDRYVNVTVRAEGSARERRFFLGALQEDLPVQLLQAESDHDDFVHASAAAIGGMAAASVVVLVASCSRYRWWEWRMRLWQTEANPLRDVTQDSLVVYTELGRRRKGLIHDSTGGTLPSYDPALHFAGRGEDF
jgi:hypothetical protein